MSKTKTFIINKFNFITKTTYVYFIFTLFVSSSWAEPQYNLTSCDNAAKHFMSNVSISHNKQRALNEIKNCARNGNIKSQIMLYMLYIDGISVDYDKHKAIYWLKKAAKNNDSDAQSLLAEHYLGNKKYQIAIDLLKKSLGKNWQTKCKGINPLLPNPLPLSNTKKTEEITSCEELIRAIKLRNKMIKRNKITQANNNYLLIKSSSKASIETIGQYALQGSPNAQLDFGNAFFYGDIIKKDLKKSLYWYIMAFHQDVVPISPIYYYHTGLIYYTLKIYNKAFAAYEIAAFKGNLKAAHELSEMYFKGIGVPANYVKSYMWANYFKARSNEKKIPEKILSNNIKLLKLLNKTLSPDLISNAQIGSEALYNKIVIKR